MKKIEILEVGMVTVGLLAAGAGLVFAGVKTGMKQGLEEGEKTGFNKGATAQYNHMMKDKGKKPIGFGPQVLVEVKPDEESNEESDNR